jgi:hypothetical protein
MVVRKLISLDRIMRQSSGSRQRRDFKNMAPKQFKLYFTP